MNILMLGYGKMGKEIELKAIKRGHEMPYKITKDNRHELESLGRHVVDVAIEFTEPASAVQNIRFCLEKGIPVVTGTTGWHDRIDEVKALCEQHQGSVFFASNFSIGVNIFFKLNQHLAKVMGKYPEYKAMITESHHTQKLDAPSGTAVTLGQDLVTELQNITNWHLEEGVHIPNSLPIQAIREDGVFGEHEVTFKSEIDTISIKHEAHSRKGFAKGAIIAAEWIVGKKGFFGMDDLLNH